MFLHIDLKLSPLRNIAEIFMAKASCYITKTINKVSPLKISENSRKSISQTSYRNSIYNKKEFA
jgi:hypothetical protein